MWMAPGSCTATIRRGADKQGAGASISQRSHDQHRSFGFQVSLTMAHQTRNIEAVRMGEESLTPKAVSALTSLPPKRVHLLKCQLRRSR